MLAKKTARGSERCGTHSPHRSSLNSKQRARSGDSCWRKAIIFEFWSYREDLLLSFIRESGIKRTPFSFLFNSLTELYIANSRDGRTIMSAHNTIWILVLCPHLQKAAVSFNLDRNSFNYLVEYSEVFKNGSNVKQLALFPNSFNLKTS